MDTPSSPEEPRLSLPKQSSPEHVDQYSRQLNRNDIDRFAAGLDLEENQDIAGLAADSLEEGALTRGQALLRRANADIKAFYDSIPSASEVPTNLPEHMVPADPGVYDDPEF
jgi:hypothetical protein